MSSNDSSSRRDARDDRADAGSGTPIAFYVMMGAMALAVLYFLYAILFM